VLLDNTKHLLTFKRSCCGGGASTCKAIEASGFDACDVDARQPWLDVTRRHWQASQSGLSMAQNLMSLAGSSVEGEALAAAPLAPTPCIDTAFIAPGATVDFSA
jgi:hypothetical protein